MPDDGYKLSKQAVQRTAKAVREVRGGVGTPSRRPTPTRRRDRSGAGKKYELLQGIVSAADTTAEVYTLTATPVQLPTGAKSIPTGTIKAFDEFLLEPSVSDPVICIHKVGCYDDSGGSATHGQVDWMILPFSGAANPVRVVTVYHATLSGGEAVDPIGANRYFHGTLNSPDDIWIDSLDTKRLGRAWLPAAGKFLGLLQGTYDPGADERHLYKIQPPAVGVVLALANSAGSAASWATATAPTMGTVNCSLYRYDEAGAIEVWDADVNVSYAAEVAAEAGKIFYVNEFEGRWHVIAELCAVASGFSE